MLGLDQEGENIMESSPPFCQRLLIPDSSDSWFWFLRWFSRFQRDQIPKEYRQKVPKRGSARWFMQLWQLKINWSCMNQNCAKSKGWQNYGKDWEHLPHLERTRSIFHIWKGPGTSSTSGKNLERLPHLERTVNIFNYLERPWSIFHIWKEPGTSFTSEKDQEHLPHLEGTWNTFHIFLYRSWTGLGWKGP